MIVELNDGIEAYEFDGERFKLTCLPTHPALRALFPSIREAIEVIPESKWRVIDNRGYFNVPSYMLNQRSHGSCVGFSSAGALMKARTLVGQTHQRLSGAYVYSFINGGRDQGASIGDSLDVLRDKGTCLEAEVGWDQIYPNQIPASARTTAERFKLEEAYRVDTFEEAASALQCPDFVLVYAVHVGGTFDRLDADGVVGLDRGPGNHAVHACGMSRSNRWGWQLDGFNSWGETWGDNGRFRSAKAHWDSVQQDAYVIRVPKWDHKDPKQPPIARE